MDYTADHGAGRLSAPVRRQLRFGFELLAALGVIAFMGGFIGVALPGIGIVLIILGVPTAVLVALIGSAMLVLDGFRHLGEVETYLDRAVTLLAGPACLVLAYVVFFPFLTAGAWLALSLG